MKMPLLSIAIFVLTLFLSACEPRQDAHSLDRLLIADQIAKYAQLWDRKDSNALTELFTEDAIMEWRISGADVQPTAINGRDAIRAYAKQAHTERLAGRQSRHHFSGLVYESLDPNAAVTEHIFLVTHVVPGEKPFVAASGTYRIEWIKAEEEWLMSKRTLFVDR